MRALWTEELRQGIRALYPAWAALGRPALPPELASLDLLHAPSPSAVPPPGPRQRLVVTAHDLAFVTHPEAFPRRWRLQFRAGLRRAVRSATALIAVSESTARDLERVGGAAPDRVHVVPLAAALPSSTLDVDAVAARYRIHRPYVLYAGTLDPRKNLPRLVRAYRRVAAAGAPHALVLVGPLGWRPAALLRELEPPAPGRVILTGRVPAADLDALYRGADAFVYPSLYEGFGLPVLDALARGVATVTSSTSSLPEVTGEAALHVDPLSEADIADSLSRVLEDRALAERLSREGRTRAAAFSWEATARKTLDVYRSIL
jgi:glycosyltransferase involved in cell wall biosynthesis